MTRAPVTWARALRATTVAALLALALAVAAGNFVLVDVHVLALGFETRLAWAVLVPAGLAFGLGVIYGRAGARSADAASGHVGHHGLAGDDRGQRQAEVRDAAGEVDVQPL
ncbi:MAG: hypothetical protein ABI950_10420 [Solirubrobacteraceae bacterium]